MLKYHIQTSGRSLHAQEIDFNDIRNGCCALYAIYDNCNSLHTNAYDEVITTPTEESVRRAEVAIQLIINKELGLAKMKISLQGSFIIEELTDLRRGGNGRVRQDHRTRRVLGSMETMYQRGKIQEESLYYETLKHTGEFPIIGVNISQLKGSPTVIPREVIKGATEEEKQLQISMLENRTPCIKTKRNDGVHSNT